MHAGRGSCALCVARGHPTDVNHGGYTCCQMVQNMTTTANIFRGGCRCFIEAAGSAVSKLDLLFTHMFF